MTDTHEPSDRNTPSSARPWRVRLFCCGREIPSDYLATWGEADAIRESYVSVDGHVRSALVELSEMSTAPDALLLREQMLEGEYLARCKAEAERLCAELADWKDSHAAVMAEKCAPDERHCSCVPNLRRELAEAVGLLRRMRDSLWAVDRQEVTSLLARHDSKHGGGDGE